MSRTKGSLNYKTRAIIPILDQLKELNFDVVRELYAVYHEIDDPGKKADILMRLMDFIYPKKRSIEITERPTKEMLAEWVREYLDEGSDNGPISVVPRELP